MISSLDPYSKVLALTQGLLNKSFQDLKAAYPNLPPFRSNDELAKISLDIGAPAIRIKSGEKFYLKIPMNGTIEVLSLKETATLTNWEVVQEFDISRLAAISGNDKYNRSNLSIEWLYTIVLSLVEDGYSPDHQESTCAQSTAVGAPKISLHDWFSQNPRFEAPLLDIFKKWPLKMRDRGYNAAGLQVNIAPPSTVYEKLLEVGAEYEATKSLIYQDSHADNSTAAAGLNSILVCGSNVRSLTPKVGPNPASLCQNFTKQSLSPFTQEFESGLFMLSYQNLLERIVIPELFVLNEAAELTIGLPTRADWGTAKATYEPVYGLKRDFVQDKEATLTSPTSSPYKFERVDAADGLSTVYKWASANRPVIETKEAFTDCPKQTFSNSSLHESLLTWKAGEDFLVLTFSITWKISSKRGDDPDKPSSELSFTEITKYSIKIRFSSTGGLLAVRFFDTPSEDAAKQGVKNFTCISTDLVGLGILKFNERRFSANFGRFVEKSLRPSIDAVISKIQAKFNTQFSWGLPENRWFKFQYPTLTAKGDFLSEITYLLPRDPSLFKPAPLLEDRPVTKPDTDPKPLPRKNDLILTWTLERSKRAQLTLTGTNNGYDPVGIGKLDFVLLCGLPHLLPRAAFEKKPQASSVPKTGTGYISVTSPPVAGIDVSSKDFVKWQVTIKPKSNLLALEENEAIIIQIDTGDDLQSSGSDEVTIEESPKDIDSGSYLEKHSGWASITLA